MKTIFITGGTGFMGRFLAMNLLRSGNRLIFLAKNSKTKTAGQRIDEALRFVDDDYLMFKNRYQVLEGDVSEPDCGLSPCEIATLRQLCIEDVWHLAGSIAFSEDKREETYRTNVDGTANLLDLCSSLHIKRMFFTSTAYVCGDRKGMFREDELDCGQRFFNPYEESKYLAEMQVMDWADRNPDTTTMIFRPSIVVGNSRDGQISGYSGYYAYMRTYHIIGKMLARGKMNGIGCDSAGKYALPLRVPGVYDTPLNNVTIDYAVETMVALAAAGVAGTYNITPDEPETYGYWLEQGTDFLGFSGITVQNTDSTGVPGLLSALETQINKGIADYIPYVSQQPLFDKSNVKKALGANYKSHPRSDKSLVSTLLSYAVAHDFKEQVDQDNSIGISENCNER